MVDSNLMLKWNFDPGFDVIECMIRGRSLRDVLAFAEVRADLYPVDEVPQVETFLTELLPPEMP